MLMGTGNLTELTEADSLGVTAMLWASVPELAIRNVLVVQVSPHTRRTVEEHDAARRVMYAARQRRRLPERLRRRASRRCTTSGPFASTPDEIAAAAAPGPRRELPHRGRRRTASTSTTATSTSSARTRWRCFPKLGVEADGGHAFYLGAELAKAEIAWRLGKRYAQDEPLDWGCAADLPEEDERRASRTRATRSMCARSAA